MRLFPIIQPEKKTRLWGKQQKFTCQPRTECVDFIRTWKYRKRKKRRHATRRHSEKYTHTQENKKIHIYYIYYSSQTHKVRCLFDKHPCESTITRCGCFSLFFFVRELTVSLLFSFINIKSQHLDNHVMYNTQHEINFHRDIYHLLYIISYLFIYMMYSQLQYNRLLQWCCISIKRTIIYGVCAKKTWAIRYAPRIRYAIKDASSSSCVRIWRVTPSKGPMSTRGIIPRDSDGREIRCTRARIDSNDKLDRDVDAARNRKLPRCYTQYEKHRVKRDGKRTRILYENKIGKTFISLLLLFW